MTFEREVLRISLDCLIELYDYLTAQLIQLRKRIVELSRSEKYRRRVNLLKSFPGIGTLIAMELLVELSEIGRFARADELALYIGLTPSEFSTGSMCDRGGSPGAGTNA